MRLRDASAVTYVSSAGTDRLRVTPVGLQGIVLSVTSGAKM